LFGPLDASPGALARADVQSGLFALFLRDLMLFFQVGEEAGLSLAQVFQAFLGQVHVPAGGPQGAYGDEEGGGADCQERSTGKQE